MVIDASAGVELAADTVRGRELRALIPDDAVPWVPEAFYIECGAVLRRWELNKIVSSEQTAQAVEDLLAWPLRVAQIRALFPAAWSLRGRLTFPDALYVTLAEHLGGVVLTDDQKLANAPGLPATVLHLPARDE